MAGKEENSDTTPGDDAYEVELAIGNLQRLLERYKTRERGLPDDMVAGASQIVLLKLLDHARNYLPSGAIHDALGLRLLSNDADVPSPPTRVSDEIDLLEQVIAELKRTRGSDTLSPRIGSSEKSHGSPKQTKWGGGPGGGEPHRNKRTPQSPPPESEHRGHAVFPHAT